MDRQHRDSEEVPRSSTLEQLDAEVERIRRRESRFDTYTHWSGKELGAQRRELGFIDRRMKLLSLAAGLFVVIFLGFGVWGYQKIRADGQSIAAMPDPEALVARVDERVDLFAEQLADLSAEGQIIQGFADRIAALEATSQTTLEALRGQVDQAARVEAAVRLDTARRLDEVTPRLDAVESSTGETQERLAGLGEEIARMRLSVAQQLASLEFRTDGMVRLVEDRVAGNERGLEAVSWEVGRERLDFELFEDYRFEVAPGIVLNLSNVNVAYQKVSGWIHLVSEGRFLRIEDHPIRQSLMFYGPDDDRSYELVFTRVRPDIAIGYVRVPSESGIRVVNQVREPGFEDRLSVVSREIPLPR